MEFEKSICSGTFAATSQMQVHAKHFFNRNYWTATNRNVLNSLKFFNIVNCKFINPKIQMVTIDYYYFLWTIYKNSQPTDEMNERRNLVFQGSFFRLEKSVSLSHSQPMASSWSIWIFRLFPKTPTVDACSLYRTGAEISFRTAGNWNWEFNKFCFLYPIRSHEMWHECWNFLFIFFFSCFFFKINFNFWFMTA